MESPEDVIIKVEGETLVTIVWEGNVDLTWSAGGQIGVPASYFEDVPAGAILTFHFQQKDAWGQAQINNGAWGVISGLGLNGYLKTDEVGDKSVTSFDNELTQDILDEILSKRGGWIDGIGDMGLILQGSDWTMTKITITVAGGGPKETVIWDEGALDLDWWPNVVFLNVDDFVDVPAGSILTLYFQQHDAWGQMKICYGDWGEMDLPELGGSSGTVTTNTYNDKSVTSQEILLTQDLLDEIISTGGMVIQGENWTFTRASITVMGG